MKKKKKVPKTFNLSIYSDLFVCLFFFFFDKSIEIYIKKLKFKGGLVCLFNLFNNS
jgi:hypothetical protein